jgi:hypothetical protein
LFPYLKKENNNPKVDHEISSPAQVSWGSPELTRLQDEKLAYWWWWLTGKPKKEKNSLGDIFCW